MVKCKALMRSVVKELNVLIPWRAVRATNYDGCCCCCCCCKII